MYYLSYNFVVRALDFLQVHEYALLSQVPHNVFSPCNVTPGGGARRGWWNSGEVRRRCRPGMGAGWCWGALGPISTLG
jgi:hypothetical protein